MGGAPASEFAHALRWFNQINSYGSERSAFPGVKKPLDQYGPASVSGGGDAKPAAAADDDDDDDDDDMDLFGSDDDEEASAEAEKIKQERCVFS